MTFGPIPSNPDFAAQSWSSSPREKCFFVVGMIILPPFWLWWTLRRGFSERQRLAACVWTTVYLVVLLATWRLMEDRYLAAAYAWPLISMRVSLALALWFLVRLVGFGKALLGLLVGMDAIAILSSLAVPAFEKACALHPGWGLWPMAFPPLFFATLHLALDPCRRAVARFKIRTTPWLARHNFRW